LEAASPSTLEYTETNLENIIMCGREKPSSIWSLFKTSHLHQTQYQWYTLSWAVKEWLGFQLRLKEYQANQISESSYSQGSLSESVLPLS
jgi:hypothetical protein